MRFNGFWGLALFLLCLLLSGATGGWVAVWLLVPEDDVVEKPDHEVISRAMRFELLDNDGNVRAVLGMGVRPYSSPGLVFYDAQGNEVRETRPVVRTETTSSSPRRIRAESLTIMCNDGTRSSTCTNCSQGCCSHHGGCR